MLKLKNRSITPHGGYRDLNPQANFPFVADHFDQLVEKERAYLKVNGHTIPDDLASQIENRLCRLMPPGICESDDGRSYNGGRSNLPHERIINNSMAVKSQSVCTTEVAQRRAETCAACPHNVIKRGCGSCRGVDKAIRDMTQGRSSRLDSRLNVCDLLGVYCRVLVHSLYPGVRKSDISRLPQNCWVRNK